MTELDPTRRADDAGAHPAEAAAGAASLDKLPPADASTPTVPVTTGGSRPGRSRFRWAVAGLVTVLVAGIAGAAALLLTSDSADPDVLAWAPADRVSYVELRLDLPGSQQAEIAKVLARFPGFDDQSALPAKIAETLDRLVGEATDGRWSYREDVDPWFADRISVSAGPAPAGASADVADAHVLVLLAMSDDTAALAWAREAATEAGATISTETHAGVTISIVEVAQPQLDGFDELPVDMTPPKLGYAVVGPTLAFGDVASIRAAIDTGGTSGLATTERFREARADLSGDRLAFMWADTAAAMSADLVPADLDPDGTLRALAELVREITPAWMAATVRAVDGTLVMDTRSPRPTAFAAATPRASAIASLVPPDTLFLTSGHDVGTALETLRALLAAKPAFADAVREVEGVLAFVGGFDAVTGWIGDVGVAVAPDPGGDGVVGGLVVTPTDAAKARQLFTTLGAFLALGGGDMGFEVRTEMHGGAEITILDLGPLDDLTDEATGGMLPVPGGNAELAFTVTDEVVVVGLGSSFVRAVLDARDGPSLADDGRFAALLARAGGNHGQLGWVDLAAIRGLVESAIPASERAEYDADVRPYLAPFDVIISVVVPGETIDTGRAIITFTP